MSLTNLIVRVVGACLLLAVDPVVDAQGAAPRLLSEQEWRDGWIQLFDGDTVFGWRTSEDGNWKASDGVLIGTAKHPTLLLTTSEFGDFVLKFDIRATSDTESRVFLRIPLDTGKAADGYELSVATATATPIGSFVHRANSVVNEVSSGWNSVEVHSEHGQFVVKLNERVVLDYTDSNPKLRGAIGLQTLNGTAEFRNIVLRPLRLTELFNGRDLQGWRIYPGQKTEVTVTTSGEIHLQNGKGQLETVTQYADFVLQLDACLNGGNLNSGLFFRCVPGELLNGYECQIDNRLQDEDRTKPLDYGTGGIYRHQGARRVICNDQEWFRLTLAATGSHFATWVNGFPTSEWTDLRSPDENPRKGSRVDAGTIAIQAHDQTTDLLVRSIRVSEFPARHDQ